MKLRKALAACILAGLSLGLVGCGNDNKVVTPSSTVAYSKDDKAVNPGAKRSTPPPIPPPPKQ